MDKFIEDNIVTLSPITDVSDTLLFELLNRQVITDEAKDEIIRLNGAKVKAGRLYNVIKITCDEEQLPDILLSLERSSNKRALKVFKEFAKGHEPIQTKAPIPVEEIEGCGPSKLFSSSTQNNLTTFLSPTSYEEEYSNLRLKKALIINVLRNRTGAEHDTQPLSEVLVGCGFQVTLCSDFTTQGILAEIAKFKRGLKCVDGILVAVMSHGTGSTKFVTENSELLDINKDVVREFNNLKCQELLRKPKIFLANFCRGAKNLHEDAVSSAQQESDNDEDDTGVYSDIIKCFSTYDEYVSKRNPDKGTVFIQTFCSVLQQCTDGTKDFKKIMDEVFTLVSNVGGQCPPYEVTGFKNLYLQSGKKCDYSGCCTVLRGTPRRNYEHHLVRDHQITQVEPNGFAGYWTYNLDWVIFERSLIPPTIMKEYGETFILNMARPGFPDKSYYYLWVTVGGHTTADKFEYEFVIKKDTKDHIRGTFPVVPCGESGIGTVARRRIGAISAAILEECTVRSEDGTKIFETRVTIRQK